eukprot:TRINITY_DN7774_c1_g1_i1.p2 TRINITY_DN7774_c1_g1~~TRINITY_DN7774_c1_g1_i1.p2  ORF type:complete len:114 (-),score=9.81 TRINITY_DN7774_c1_g1_i1:151-492(-)
MLLSAIPQTIRLSQMDTDVLGNVGFLLGTLGVTAAVFVGVSFSEVKRKVDEQVSRGERPYDLPDVRTGSSAASLDENDPSRRKRSSKRGSVMAEPGFRSTPTQPSKKKKKKKK